MSIKLIAIDLYGTLIGPGGRGEMPAKNRDAVLKALNQGVKIALVTGLNRGSVMNILYNANLEGANGLMVSCYNGAVMFEPESGDTMWEYSLNRALAAELVAHPDVAPHFPMAHGPFDDRNLMWIQRGIHPQIVAQYLTRRIDILGSSSTRIVDNLAEQIDFAVQDISFLAPEASIHSAADHLGEQYSGKLKLIKSLWRDGYAWLEILHFNAGKGEAVRQMRKRFHLDKDSIMSIGDNLNDIDMFGQAGISVAMGNAPEEVRQAATHQTLPWDQAGVAYAIKTWASIG